MTISRGVERVVWATALVLAIGAAVYSPAGRYQFHAFDTPIGFRIFDTRTGSVVTWVINDGAWYQLDLSKNNGQPQRIGPAKKKVAKTEAMPAPDSPPPGFELVPEPGKRKR